MPTKFPYSVKQTERGKKTSVIYVWLEIKTKKGIYRFQRFLFDTGADYTSLPKFMSQVVGFNLEEAKQEIMYTANNEPMTTYRGSIEIILGNKKFKLPVVFTDKDDTPFLLGRMGIIDKFDILLSKKDQEIIFSWGNNTSCL